MKSRKTKVVMIGLCLSVVLGFSWVGSAMAESLKNKPVVVELKSTEQLTEESLVQMLRKNRTLTFRVRNQKIRVFSEGAGKKHYGISLSALPDELEFLKVPYDKNLDPATDTSNVSVLLPDFKALLARKDLNLDYRVSFKANAKDNRRIEFRTVEGPIVENEGNELRFTKAEVSGGHYGELNDDDSGLSSLDDMGEVQGDVLISIYHPHNPYG